MTTPLTCASDRVFGVRWWTLTTALLGLPLLGAIAGGDEYRRPVYSATASVHHGTGYAGTAPTSQVATPVQRIPAYGSTASPNDMRQAAYTGVSGVGAEAVLRAYPCTPAQGAVLDATLNEQFGSLGSFRIVHDRQASQLLVMAPEAVQQKVAAQIQAAASVIAATPRQIPTQPAGTAPIPVCGTGAEAGVSAQTCDGSATHLDFTGSTGGSLEPVASTGRRACGLSPCRGGATGVHCLARPYP